MSNESFREFLDWFNIKKDTLPSEFTDDMSMEKARLLWEEKYKETINEDLGTEND